MAYNVQRVYKDGNLALRETVKGRATASNVWADCPLLAALNDPTLLAVYENHFLNYVTTMDGLTTVATDSGGVTVDAATAGRYGVMNLSMSDGSVGDNDEVYVGSTTKSFILSAGRKLWFEAWVKFTEANTDDANVIVGLSSTYAANTLQDNGGGPPAEYDGIVFFKVDGGTVWNCETSAATTQQTTATTTTRTSGSWTKLAFKYDGASTVTFYINDTAVASHATTLPTAAMGLIFGGKNGDTNEEGVLVDFVKVAVEL